MILAILVTAAALSTEPELKRWIIALRTSAYCAFMPIPRTTGIHNSLILDITCRILNLDPCSAGSSRSSSKRHLSGGEKENKEVKKRCYNCHSSDPAGEYKAIYHQTRIYYGHPFVLDRNYKVDIHPLLRECHCKCQEQGQIQVIRTERTSECRSERNSHSD